MKTLQRLAVSMMCKFCAFVRGVNFVAPWYLGVPSCFLYGLVQMRHAFWRSYELAEGKAGALGSGSYGTVCIAKHRGTGERFACKQLKLNRATPRYVSKLYHEVGTPAQPPCQPLSQSLS